MVQFTRPVLDRARAGPACGRADVRFRNLSAGAHRSYQQHRHADGSISKVLNPMTHLQKSEIRNPKSEWESATVGEFRASEFRILKLFRFVRPKSDAKWFQISHQGNKG